jgi:hypothetical protein
MDELDRNRLEEFRQLRQEVRHSEEYLIVGIDIAKDRHHAFFGTATGKTFLRRLVFSNDDEGFRKLLDQAEALRARHGLKKVVYGMEPTANYHKPLGEYLIHLGRSVVLVSGVTVKRNRESLDGRWDKHQAWCEGLGQCGRFDFAGEMFVLRISLGAVKRITGFTFAEKAIEETRAWLQGSDSE